MSDHFTNELPEELIEFERALSTLAPAPSQLDRDRLMFAAGVGRGMATQVTGTLAASRSLGMPTSDQVAASSQSLVGASLYLRIRPTCTNVQVKDCTNG